MTNGAGAGSFVRFGNRSAGRKNVASAYRHQNAARRHSGRRALSLACATFYLTSVDLLRNVSKSNERPCSNVRKPSYLLQVGVLRDVRRPHARQLRRTEARRQGDVAATFEPRDTRQF